MTVRPTGAGDGPIAEVREGMAVVDRAGIRLGKVEYVRMGDPAAVTAQGQETAGVRGETVHLNAEARELVSEEV